MKKLFCAAALLTAAIIGVTGCSAGSEKSEGNIMVSDAQNDTELKRLTYLGYKSEALNVRAIETCIQGFMKETPDCEISYEGLKGSEYWDALEKRVASGHLDDIFMIDHDHLIDYRNENKLEDLSDLEAVASYDPVVRSQFTDDDGSVYFLPTCIITYGLYCNLDMLEENGFAPPENFSRFSEICDYFVGKGITPVIGNNYASMRNIIVAKGMYPIYQSENREEEIAKINSGESDIGEILKPGLELAQTFIDRGWIDCEEVLNTTQTKGDLELFKAGDRPFMLTGSWASPRVAGEGGVDFEYAIYPYPFLENGCVLLEDIATCVSINSESDKKDIAKDFIEYMMRPEVLWEYCDSQSSFTPLSGDERLPSDKTLSPQIPYLSNGQTVIGSDYSITLPLDEALNTLSEEMLGGADIPDLSARLREILAQ